MCFRERKRVSTQTRSRHQNTEDLCCFSTSVHVPRCLCVNQGFTVGQGTRRERQMLSVSTEACSSSRRGGCGCRLHLRPATDQLPWLQRAVAAWESLFFLLFCLEARCICSATKMHLLWFTSKAVASISQSPPASVAQFDSLFHQNSN